LNALLLCALLGADRDPVQAERPRQPPYRAVLWIALDDGRYSQMLQRELERDWSRPNPAVVLTSRERAAVARVAAEMSGLQQALHARFEILYVERPPFVCTPAVRIGRGRWESLDRRAFAFETMPLRTLDWYRARHVAVFDVAHDASFECWETQEGFSGPENPESAPPWEVSHR
jgi:hypothetical protein